MPFIKNSMKYECFTQGFREFAEYLKTVPVERRKGFVAWAVMYMAKYTFNLNYFGRSTGTDAVRSAFVELKKELDEYEQEKKEENGGV